MVKRNPDKLHKPGLDWKAGWAASIGLIMGGQVFSLIGSNAAQYALIWWLTVQTQSASVLAIAGSVGFLPTAILGPFAGAWIDRLSRKKVLIYSDLLIALASLILMVVALIQSTPPVWLVLIILAIRAVGSVFHTPAWNATLPLLANQQVLEKLAGWNLFIVGGTQMIGPLLGGILITAFHLPAVMLVDVLGAVVATATLLPIHYPEPAPAPHQHILQQMGEGLQLMFRNQILVRMVLPLGIAVLFYLPVASLYPLMTNGYFGKSAWHSSLVIAAFGSGLLISSLVSGFRGGFADKYRQVVVSVTVLGTFLLISGLLAPTMFWWFVAFAVIMGLSGSLAVMALFVHVQQTIPPVALGRVFSVISSLLALATPVGLFLAAPFADALGINNWFIIAGSCIALAGATSLFLNARLRRA